MQLWLDQMWMLENIFYILACEVHKKTSKEQLDVTLGIISSFKSLFFFSQQLWRWNAKYIIKSRSWLLPQVWFTKVSPVYLSWEAIPVPSVVASFFCRSFTCGSRQSQANVAMPGLDSTPLISASFFHVSIIITDNSICSSYSLEVISWVHFWSVPGNCHKDLKKDIEHCPPHLRFSIQTTACSVMGLNAPPKLT